VDDSIFYAAFFLPSAAAVIIFFMKYLASILQARVRIAVDAAYRDITAKAVAAQVESAAALSSFGTILSEIQSQLAVIEKILKDVN
jgi:hypothetical protein